MQGDTLKENTGISLSFQCLSCNLNIAKSAFSASVADINDDKMDTITIKDEVYYFVDNEKQLRLIGTEDYPLSANYMLKRDIDLKNPWIPIGNNDALPFTGRFNGNGFTIKNISIDDQKGCWKYLGFFGLVEGGKIHNVTLENVSIKTNRKSDLILLRRYMPLRYSCQALQKARLLEI